MAKQTQNEDLLEKLILLGCVIGIGVIIYHFAREMNIGGWFKKTGDSLPNQPSMLNTKKRVTRPSTKTVANQVSNGYKKEMGIPESEERVQLYADYLYMANHIAQDYMDKKGTNDSLTSYLHDLNKAPRSLFSKAVAKWIGNKDRSYSSVNETYLVRAQIDTPEHGQFLSRLKSIGLNITAKAPQNERKGNELTYLPVKLDPTLAYNYTLAATKPVNA